jgi:hypothetical protein
MLPQFYQNHLKKYLSETQLITLKVLVWLLSNQKQVKIGFPGARMAPTTKTCTDLSYALGKQGGEGENDSCHFQGEIAKHGIYSLMIGC